MDNNFDNDITTVVDNREKTIIKTSLIGIITNLFLSGFKAVIGLISGSIAIVLDAVNNLSDALSSVVTIIGAKLGARQPDKKHPLGHGRIEYISSLIVAAIVLYAGITSLVESVKKIFNPETADYNMITLIIIAVAVVVKIILGLYVKKQGKKVNSGALTASGADALFDAIISASVLASAIIYLIWNISLEAYVGVIISVFIIKAGVEMMVETIGDIIGRRSNPQISARIKKIINEENDVRGAYDLTLFNYGPNMYYGSVHMELPDVMTVDKVDILTRRIQMRVYQETGVILTGVGVYSYNTTNEEAVHIRNELQKVVLSHDWALQLHGFYADTVNKTIRFDVVVSFDIDKAEATRIICDEAKSLYPDYEIHVIPDIDISD